MTAMETPIESLAGPGTLRPSQTDLLEIFAAAYQRAAMLGLAMRNAADVLEVLRTDLAAGSTDQHPRRIVNRSIAMASDVGLRDVLIKLKRDVDARLIDAEIDRLLRVPKGDRSAAWRATLAMAAETSWKSLIARMLKERPPDGGFDDEANNRLRAVAHFLLDELWPEAYPLFSSLGQDDEIPAGTRAGLLITAAEIQMGHLYDRQAAQAMLEAADRLAPDDVAVLYGWGEYLLEIDDEPGARERAKKLLSRTPPHADGQQLTGDCLLHDEQVEAAEVAYQTAIGMEPGDVGIHRSLFRLYGRPDRIAENGPRLEAIAERIAALDDWGGRYGAYIELGYLYQQAGLFDQAHTWFQRSIALDASRADGYRAEGYLFVDEQRYEEAKAAFHKSIQAARDSFDARWGLAVACESSGDLKSALACYRKCLEFRPAWESRIRASIGEVLRQLDRKGESEKELTMALRIDSTNQPAVDSVQALATDIAQAGDPSRAVALIGKVRDIRNDSDEAEYHNVVGNIWYLTENYDAALESYVLALKLNPKEAMYHSNIAGAYSRLGRWDDAIREFATAFKLDHDDDRNRGGLALLANDMGSSYLEDGHVLEAVEQFERAVSLAPDDAVMQSNLAASLEYVREPGKIASSLERAVAALDRALEQDADNADYVRRRDFLRGRLRLVRERGEQSIDLIPIKPGVSISIGSGLVPFIAGDGPGGLQTEVDSRINVLRRQLQEEFGVPIPGVRFSELSEDTTAYSVLLFNVRVGEGQFDPAMKFVPDSPSKLRSLGLRHEAAFQPGTRQQGAWLGPSDWKKAVDAGLPLWGVAEYMLRHLEQALRINLALMLGREQLVDLLLELDGPDARQILASRDQFGRLILTLRGLLAEQTTIKPLHRIVKTFASARSQDLDAVQLAEHIRFALRGTRTGTRDGAAQPLPAGRERVAAACLRRGGGRALAARVGELADFRRSVLEGRDGEEGQMTAISVRDASLRPFVAALLGPECHVVVAEQPR